MGDIQVGDEVLTPFGTVTTVTGVYPKGIRSVYGMTLRDGSYSESCDEHLWTIEREITVNKNKSVDGKTYKRINETLSTMMVKERIDKGRPINLPIIEPVNHPVVDLPIDPYVLGVILGDCHVQKNGVTKLTCADTEIVDELRRRGAIVVNDTVNGGRKDGIGYRINKVNTALREMNLAGKRSWEKLIPEMYLYASTEQRLDLLRGLMDTDGTISARGEMEFTSASRKLAEQVQYLVRSLGGRVSLNVKNKVMYTSPNQLEPKQARPAYRVQNIRLFKLNPFYLLRKAERWRERTDTSGNKIISIEYVRDEEVQCIRVADERHLYITDDFMPTHNTSNIVFLKSTDDAMIETLSKLSGKTHEATVESKTITRDNERLMNRTEGKISFTMSTKEKQVITFEDLLFMEERNSVVYRAGNNPIWNKNKTILPMSWRLNRDTIRIPGKEFSLQTVPTLSSALDFDIKKNQPDFFAMLDKRLDQAKLVDDMVSMYRDVYGYTENDMVKLDEDVFSDEIMDYITQFKTQAISQSIEGEEWVQQGYASEEEFLADMAQEEAAMGGNDLALAGVSNKELATELVDLEAQVSRHNQKIYGGGYISYSMLMNEAGQVNYQLARTLSEAYQDCVPHFTRDTSYRVDPDSNELFGQDGYTLYVKSLIAGNRKDYDKLSKAAEEANSRLYSEDEFSTKTLSYEITDDFIRHLCSLPSWTSIANGRFDKAVSDIYQRTKLVEY